MASFRRLEETEDLRGPVVSVRTGRFEAPDGHVFERQIVRHPGAVVVVPVGDDRTVTLVRQYRAAIDVELLELPAGKRDVEGEEPELTARRELAEEVGMEAGSMVKLAEFWNSPGFSDELSMLYLATGLAPCPKSAQGIEEGHMEVVGVPLEEAPRLIESGAIRDAKTIIGLCLALEHLQGRGLAP